MKHEHRQVNYSYEHGDESLPLLKNLVSETQDPMKSKLMEYLKTNCIIACPGIIEDEINPGNIIGCGNQYSDGIYFWDDVFFNYVDQYNIPVPEEFRNHILENFDRRMKRHALLQLIDRVEIHNNPYLAFEYNFSIEKSGVIWYRNNTDCKDGAVFLIKADDAQYIINPGMTELFCYDTDEHGVVMIDGHHWEILFYRKDELVDKIEGLSGEDKWRYGKFREIVELSERYIPKALGYELMNLYKDEESL